MFDSLRRFAVKHKTLATVLSCIFLCLTYTVLLVFLDASRWLLITVNVFMVFVSFLYVEGCPLKLMNDATKKHFETCDPYPLLSETDFLLSGNPKNRNLVVIKINKAVALRAIGEYKQTYEILQSIEVEAYTYVLPGDKVVYYNNLGDILFLLGDYEKSKENFHKAFRILDAMKDGAQKEKLKKLMTNAQVSLFYMEKDFAKVIETISTMPLENNESRVEAAYLKGMSYMELGDVTNAIECFSYVVNNGNKLHRVKQATSILNHITKTN